MTDKVEPYVPVFNRGQNSLLRYEERPFDDGVGHTATLVVAIFLDKNKKQQEMVTQVKWHI